ncbi:MAG: hypothetical protein ACE5LA_06025 [Dehalococcoidales bacterium]
MKIAVLGWGSLIWIPKRKSGVLNLADDKWFSDGPGLPIEFARISRDKRLTLVLFPAAKKVPVLWAIMALNNLDEAINNLREVEGIPAFSKDRIGYVNLRSREQRSSVVVDIADEIRRWACMKKVEAVIWTDLPPKFEEETGIEFTEENVISYLNNLPDDSKKKAEEYIRRAPRQIRTGLRSAIEKKLGWFPV